MGLGIGAKLFFPLYFYANQKKSETSTKKGFVTVFTLLPTEETNKLFFLPIRVLRYDPFLSQQQVEAVACLLPRARITRDKMRSEHNAQL